MEKLGAAQWGYISSFFPDRIGKQCRERWFNHLNPTVNKTAWSDEEEWILFLMHMKFGNKWSYLCNFLPGRTDNTIKNHWNSTMRKKIGDIEIKYKEKIEGKNENEIEKIKEEILNNCKEKVEKENKKFYDEKLKNFEKFKNTSIDNVQSILKLKKVLLLRTHSKKTKRRGRKKKNVSCEDISEYKVKNTKNLSKTKNISSKTKTQKTKKNLNKKINNVKIYKKKKLIELEENEGENEQIPENKNIINNNTYSINDSTNKESKQREFSFVIKNNEEVNNKENIYTTALKNEKNIYTANPINNINFLQDSNNISDIKNNSIIFYNNSLNKTEVNPNFNFTNINFSSEQKTGGGVLSTPIKLNQTPNLPVGRVFQKNDGLENIFEKSAFNKQDNPFPYSNIKTHLCFTSSIKKPVKIISYENTEQNAGSNINNNINNFYNNIENISPNKVIDFSGSRSSGEMRFKNIHLSSNKKQDCFNNSDKEVLNNPFNDFDLNKNITPFKVSNANLDKMFFSNINSGKK